MVYPSSGELPVLRVSPYCQNMSPAIPLVARAVVCQAPSTEALLDVTPYSSAMQGLPTEAQTEPWLVIQLLPQSLVSPPIEV